MHFSVCEYEYYMCGERKLFGLHNFDSFSCVTSKCSERMYAAACLSAFLAVNADGARYLRHGRKVNF